MRAVIYIRVSSEQQKDNNSLDEQKAACVTYCDDNGLEVLSIIEDVHSAYHGAMRPGVTELIDLAERGEIDAVVMRKASRFSRNFGQSEAIREQLTAAGIQLHFYDSGQMADNASGRMMHRINATVHQFYVEEWVETSKANRETAARKGKWVGGGDMRYGLRRTDAGILIDPTQAEIIRRAYRHYLDDGLSFTKIAAMFTREQVPTNTNKTQWFAATVYRMMVGRHVIGELWYKDIMVPCPQIIDQARYDQLIAQSASNKRRHDGATKHDYLLSGGRLKCTCGNTMGARHMVHPGGYEYWYYVCNANGRSHITACIEPTVQMKDADKKVWDEVVKLFETGELADIVADELAERESKADELTLRRDSLLKTAQAKRREISVLFDEFSQDEPIVAEQAKRRIRALSGDVQALELDAGRLTRTIDQAANNETAAAEIETLTELVQDYVRQGGGSIRRDILDALGAECRLIYKDDERCIKADFFYLA